MIQFINTITREYKMLIISCHHNDGHEIAQFFLPSTDSIEKHSFQHHSPHPAQHFL